MTVNPPREDELEIRGRMDIEDIVKYQINRCNISSTDPDPNIFNSNVLVLLDILPAHKRQQVLDRQEDYGEIEKRTEYDNWCGTNILSTKRPVEEFTIDYHLLYRIVLDAFADSGLTWKIEQELIELGKVGWKKEVPTPYYGEDKQNE